MIAKYENGKYHKFFSHGGSNIDLNLITCEDKIFILPKLQSYVLHWYHKYLLHTVMYRTEEMIFQHLYWIYIINAILREISNCDTCQRTKILNKNMVNYQLSYLRNTTG